VLATTSPADRKSSQTSQLKETAASASPGNTTCTCTCGRAKVNEMPCRAPAEHYERLVSLLE